MAVASKREGATSTILRAHPVSRPLAVWVADHAGPFGALGCG